MSSQAKRIIVSGRVQEVWYRKYACEKAIELGLLGTVQNLQTGEVLIQAVGSEERLNAMEEWCWKGSPMSKVTDVVSRDSDLESYPDFRIID